VNLHHHGEKEEMGATGEVRERVEKVRRNPKYCVYKPDKRIGYGLCRASMYISLGGL
jgi:hypothetical protein